MFSVWQNGPTRLKSDFLVHQLQTFTFGIGYTLKLVKSLLQRKGGNRSIITMKESKYNCDRDDIICQGKKIGEKAELRT